MRFVFVFVFAGGSIAIAAAACTLDFDRFHAAAVASDAGAPPAASSGEAPPPSSDASSPPDVGADASIDAGPGKPPVACDEPDLLARWRFDEGAGMLVNDCSSSRHGGTIVGSARWTSGHAGDALDLEGSYVSLGNAAPLDPHGAFTATAWLRVTAFPKKPSAYVFGKTSSIYQGGWRLGVEPTSLSFTVSRGPTKPEMQTESPYATTGAWVHVAGVFSPGVGVSIYVNGVLAASRTDDPPSMVLPMPDELRIGVRGDGDPSTFFHGAVDDVRLYGRALAATQIAVVASQ